MEFTFWFSAVCGVVALTYLVLFFAFNLEQDLISGWEHRKTLQEPIEPPVRQDPPSDEDIERMIREKFARAEWLYKKRYWNPRWTQPHNPWDHGNSKAPRDYSEYSKPPRR